MGRIVARNLKCLNESGCGSSDARQLYEDGGSFCFSCQTFFPSAGEDTTPRDNQSLLPKAAAVDVMKELKEIGTLAHRGFAERQITKDVATFFGVRVSYSSDGQIDTHYYPYEGGKAYKVRTLPKDFKWVGKSTDLFGKDKFSAGGRRVVICEGEIDVMTVAQMYQAKYKKIYPVVGMSSAVMSKSLLENREWLRSFGEIVLCLDSDKAGQEATAEAIKILGIDKVKIVKLTEKDPSEVFLKHGGEALNQMIFDAASHIPSGILTKEALWDALEVFNNTPSLPYPDCLSGLNAKLKGMRLGEITLFISGTGVGKSTMLREVELHILENTPKETKVGIVSLEESPAETARKLAGMKLSRNPASAEIPLDELRPGFDAVFGEDRVILLDHGLMLNDDSIVEKLEYMCLSGCQYIVVDHITIMVSEGIGDLTGNEAQDKVMNTLARLVKKYPVWIGLVSHLRKTGVGGKSFEEGKMPSIDDIRGSGSVKQVSYDIVAFSRNLTAEGEKERNTTRLGVLKSRFTGLTGSAGGVYYQYETGRLNKTDVVNEEFVSLD